MQENFSCRQQRKKNSILIIHFLTFPLKTCTFFQVLIIREEQDQRSYSQIVLRKQWMDCMSIRLIGLLFWIHFHFLIEYVIDEKANIQLLIHTLPTLCFHKKTNRPFNWSRARITRAWSVLFFFTKCIVLLLAQTWSTFLQQRKTLSFVGEKRSPINNSFRHVSVTLSKCIDSEKTKNKRWWSIHKPLQELKRQWIDFVCWLIFLAEHASASMTSPQRRQCAHLRLEGGEESLELRP